MKKLITILLACTMIFVMTACGSKEEAPTAESTDAVSESAVQDETAAEAADDTAGEEAAEADGAADVTIEGAIWHATVNVGDYLTIKTGVKEDRKDNDPMKYMDYDGLCVEYDFSFNDDGTVAFTPCEDQTAFQTALWNKVENALKQYYQDVMEEKGVTVSVEKYMEMEKVDVDHYVKMGTHIPEDLFKANTFLTSMFPDSAYYAVDTGSNCIYWSKQYSDSRMFDAGVKWTYEITSAGINITSQTNKSGYSIDEFSGIGEASKISTSEATIYPIVMVKK